MAAADSAILFDDIFDVIKVNPEGKKFERVNRIVLKGETYECDVVLDIASEVYSLKAGDKVTLTLASTLRLDGKPEEDYYNQDGKPSLLDQYEYGMCGKTFKYDHAPAAGTGGAGGAGGGGARSTRVSIIASFGGLLMQIAGMQGDLTKVRLDQKIYVLLRKTGK